MSEFRKRPLRWLLLDGGRIQIAALLVLATFLLLAVLGVLGVVDLQNHDAVRGVAGGFVPGLVAFLSIVLGINQLVLSQELGSTGEIQDRIESVREYRHDVEAMADAAPSPVLPVGFLSFVVETIRSEAAHLEACADDHDDPNPANPALLEAVREYATGVVTEAERANGSLESLRPGRINALLPVLEYDDAYQLYEARRLESRGAKDLPTDVRESLSRLEETLELFSVARTQFRATYTQRVLARLSRQLLYVGLPALLVVVVLGLLPPPPALVAGPARVVVVSAMFAVAVAPLAVLSSYLLRVAAVSEQTIAVGPFVSRPGARENRGETPDARAVERPSPSEGDRGETDADG